MCKLKILTVVWVVTSNLGNKFKSGKYYKIHLQSTLLLHKLACGARCLKLCQKKQKKFLIYIGEGVTFLAILCKNDGFHFII